MNIIRCVNGHFFDGDENRFCPQCGVPATNSVNNGISRAYNICPSCGNTVSSSANFCKKCGAKLKQDAVNNNQNIGDTQIAFNAVNENNEIQSSVQIPSPEKLEIINNVERIIEEKESLQDRNSDIVSSDVIPEADKSVENEDESKAKGKVYFAGPLFCASEKTFNLRFSNLLESKGCNVFLPQRDGVLSPELDDKTSEEKTDIIFNGDLSEVKSSDILVFCLDGRIPDEGACVELGIAYALGKRCYGLRTDVRTLECDLPLNPMLSGCFIKIFNNSDENVLFSEFENYLDENNL